ncbi:MAG: C10 family peptidase [Bacteroidales bacterium]|nr:C10 family peptidase [Bacteroidales bacterium]
MNRFLILIALLGFLAGCSDDAPQISKEDSDERIALFSDSHIRSVAAAKDIAAQIASTLNSTSRTTRSLKHDGVTTIVHNNNLSRSESPDTIMYAVEFEDEQGFVLVSAPDNMPPVIAVIESGSFNDPRNAEIDAYQFCLAAAKDYIINEGDFSKNTKVPIEIIPQSYWVVDSVNYKHEPTVKGWWNQQWPYNLYSPKSAGCTQLATLMAMSVFEEPKTINYTFTGRDKNSESINWSEIKRHAESLTFSPDPNNASSMAQHFNLCKASKESHKTAGRLIRQIGEILGVDYTKDTLSISVDYNNAFKAIKYYLPNREFKECTLNAFHELGGYSVAIVIGLETEKDPVTKARNGHAWIADGIWRLGMARYYYELEGGGLEVPPTLPDDPSKPRYILTRTEGKIFEYIHYNWGWDNLSNGWFLSYIFDPSRISIPDPYVIESSKSENFTYRTKYICIK